MLQPAIATLWLAIMRQLSKFSIEQHQQIKEFALQLQYRQVKILMGNQNSVRPKHLPRNVYCRYTGKDCRI